jgi:hypothetical protein
MDLSNFSFKEILSEDPDKNLIYLLGNIGNHRAILKL